MDKDYVVGLFPMCADVLHTGHIAALKEARAHCDFLILALNTHPDGKCPVESVYERWTKVHELRCVDMVVPYQGRKDMELLAATLQYHVRFLGDDYKDKDWDGKAQEAARGILPFFMNRSQHNLSSTALKQRIVDAQSSSNG